MALTFIGLGSNLGDGKKNLQQAWRALAQTKGITGLAISSPYVSKPVAINDADKPATSHQFDSAQWFTNAVAVIETRLEADQLLAIMLTLEKTMGRERGKSGDRIIDLDILYYDNIVQTSEELTIPHPGIQDRLFVLAPLEELAPDRLHPVLALSSSQMRNRLPFSDDQVVKKISWQEGVNS
ncbi:MAG: 2-amino-4-hydroxy-6-hydroxymethyldihydropteridine diphosphokinase [Proteobacteria bacterium]|nr:2-amino-4-hydroxy-6-hydroxymethyldihydropteridine diphosphokinase [Pseudomonadota bacterium]MBU1714364.1 2-amino-4-hydroxy-6-hydroxymethyldihydropteridine diphosphokinase [Pseudomonadota bacterium]